MKNRKLIQDMSYARDIHTQWAKHQRRLILQDKKPVKNVGSVRWHQKWVKIYDQVIKALSK
jgi:hypothetical protein